MRLVSQRYGHLQSMLQGGTVFTSPTRLSEAFKPRVWVSHVAIAPDKLEPIRELNRVPLVEPTTRDQR